MSERLRVKAWSWGAEKSGYGFLSLGFDLRRQPAIFSRGEGPMYSARVELLVWGVEVQVYRPFGKRHAARLRAAMSEKAEGRYYRTDLR